MPRKKSKKIKEIKQLHGKEETFEPTSLDQVWGETGLTRYGTMDEKAYQDYLGNLVRSDLQMHASEVGIVPVDSRERLQKTLMSEFRKHISAYTKPAPPSSPKDKSNLTKKVRDILDEGR